MKATLCIIVLALNCAVCPGPAAAANRQRPAQQKANPGQQAARRGIQKEQLHKGQVVPKPYAVRHAQHGAQPSSAARGIRSQRMLGAESQIARGQARGATAIAMQARPARLSNVNHNPVPAAGSVRHHSANPALLGGSKSTSVSSAAALNGTRMGARR